MSLAEKIDALPQEPGVYLFKSERGKVLYVGKAQNLRARVRSYFHAGGDGRVQVPRLVEEVRDVDVLALGSVKEALLLENELIKRHRPPFNVRLRDDKQYLVLRLDRSAAWPRLTLVRRFAEAGLALLATHGTGGFLRSRGVECEEIHKVYEGSPHIVDALRAGRVDLVVNTTSSPQSIVDSFSLRRTALETRTPYITTIEGKLFEVVRAE